VGHRLHDACESAGYNRLAERPVAIADAAALGVEELIRTPAIIDIIDGRMSAATGKGIRKLVRMGSSCVRCAGGVTGWGRRSWAVMFGQRQGQTRKTALDDKSRLARACVVTQAEAHRPAAVGSAVSATEAQVEGRHGAEEICDVGWGMIWGVVPVDH